MKKLKFSYVYFKEQIRKYTGNIHTLKEMHVIEAGM